MALTTNANVTRLASAGRVSLPVVAGDHIYRDGLVGIDPAGYVKPFEPGDRFVGLAYEEKDNTTGSAGATSCRVDTEGDVILPLSGVAVGDEGKAVYATADDAIALTGHPDAFVGRILSVDSSNSARVRLRRPGERPPSDGTCVEIDVDFAREVFAALDEATATSVVCGGRIKTACVGTGLTAGTTGLILNEATGELRMLIDNDDEAENLTIETPQTCNITKGVTFEATLRLQAAGGEATDDLDFGLAGLAGGLTATERANMDATTSGLRSAKFHVDTNGLDLSFSSDDDAAPISAMDTTVDLVLQTAVSVKIICRPSGLCELWVNGARKLSSMAFSVGASGMLCGFVNLEKSSGTGVPEVRVRRLRVAGALA